MGETNRRDIDGAGGRASDDSDDTDDTDDTDDSDDSDDSDDTDVTEAVGKGLDAKCASRLFALYDARNLRPRDAARPRALSHLAGRRP